MSRKLLLCDFHIHSNWSDGRHSIDEIIDYYGQRGFQCIGITDHVCENESLVGRVAHWMNRTLTRLQFDAYLEEILNASHRAWQEYQMIVIPGVEITKNSLRSDRSAHILGLGVTQWIDPHSDITSILQSIKSQGGVTVAAHPVLTADPSYVPTLQLWGRRQEFGSLIDAWEVASGPHLFETVWQSGLAMIANSDLHHFKQMRSWKTQVYSELKMTSILKAICNQDLRFSFFDGQFIDESRTLLTDWTQFNLSPRGPSSLSGRHHSTQGNIF